MNRSEMAEIKRLCAWLSGHPQTYTDGREPTVRAVCDVCGDSCTAVSSAVMARMPCVVCGGNTMRIQRYRNAKRVYVTPYTIAVGQPSVGPADPRDGNGPSWRAPETDGDVEMRAWDDEPTHRYYTRYVDTCICGKTHSVGYVE